MRFFIKLSFHIILLIYISAQSDIYHLEPNIFTKIDIKSDITEILLSSEVSNYIILQLIFSHPSKYISTFNLYDEELVIKNYNEHDYSKNNSDIIIDSELNLGMNKVILTTNNDNNTNVILSIFSKEINNINDDIKDFIYIKYILRENRYNQEFYIEDNTIKLEQNLDKINIYFRGINQLNNYTKIEEVIAQFNIRIFDKQFLESLYENIYISIYDDENISKEVLISEYITMKGNLIKNDNQMKIASKINDNKEQILLIYAKLITNNDKIFLHYKYNTFKVDNNNNNTNDDEEVDVEKNREKNIILLIIFCGVFLFVILITSVGFYCYINFHENENTEDYSNIEGINFDKSSKQSDSEFGEDSRKNSDIEEK